MFVQNGCRRGSSCDAKLPACSSCPHRFLSTTFPQGNAVSLGYASEPAGGVEGSQTLYGECDVKKAKYTIKRVNRSFLHVQNTYIHQEHEAEALCIESLQARR
jgi:hypothetical protein